MKKDFIYWICSMLLLLGLTYFGFEKGFLHHLWDADVSKLSFVIFSIFLVFYTRLGYLIYKNNKIDEDAIDPGLEIADGLMQLGQLGTMIGFIVMCIAFTGIDLSQIENVSRLFDIATSGMSTALYTSIAGLVCGLTLRSTHYLVVRIQKKR